MVTIDSIIERAKRYQPAINEKRIRDAYEFAAVAHKDQKRFSGEPYIVHPLNVADILLEYHPDENSLIAALLHDVAEDTTYTLHDIQRLFGPEVEHLCSGLMKLSKVRSRMNDPQFENLRKLFLAMAQDIRVVMLKLCDRLHNMRTLEFVRNEKRKRIAQETLNIYAPIAARLGIYRVKTQLEDLCFFHLEPEKFKDIRSQLEKTGKWREKYIDVAQKILIETLAREGVACEVDGRVKGIYSIYRKMQKKARLSIDEIFDVFAMRVILPDIQKYGHEYIGHLYSALGIIHSKFTPLAHRFKDYVAVPKVNGYRSLHTTVMGLGPKTYTQPTEVQLRTTSMHQYAEYGIAAHWVYEDAPPEPKQNHKEWISLLKKVGEETTSSQELLESLKVDVFQDRLFVLTPRGDVKDLPFGATPIDFAYAVHTEIGNHCVGAKVNAAIVPIDYVLRNGEVVDIITRKTARPNQSWLAFVKTGHARNRIKAWFKNLDARNHLEEGRGLVNQKLGQMGFPLLDGNLSILKKYGGRDLSYKERESLLAEVGRGGLFPGALLKRVFTPDELLRPTRMLQKQKSIEMVKREREEEAPLIIGGASNMPHTFVKCCNPGASDDLVGYVTRGRGVSVHRKSCPVVRNSELHRLISVRAPGQALRPGTYSIQVLVESEDRLGLVRDLTRAIADCGINMLDFFQYPPHDGLARINFILEIENFDQLETVIEALSKIPSVRRACKVN